jgi:hypothetical protein
MIACLGVFGCAIALPFVSQLQSFLHLNHFVKLIFENNLRAIAKLTSVAFFSLPCIAFCLIQSIFSIKNLNHVINFEEKRKRDLIEGGKENYVGFCSSSLNCYYWECEYGNLSKYICFPEIAQLYFLFSSKHEEILSSI